MIKTLVLISQSYLHFASKEGLDLIAKKVRIVLIMHKSETVHPHIKDYIDQVFFVEGSLKESLRPVLDITQVIDIISAEIRRVGTSDKISVFCQQEDNVMVAAMARDFLNIPGDKSEMIRLFRDKIEMKQAVAASYPHSCPKHEILNKERLLADSENYYHVLISTLGQKLVIKPISAAGSFNVSIINNFDDFTHVKSMITDNDHQFEYEIDEFIPGIMYQCDSLVVDGDVIFSGILELGCSNFDFVQGKPLSVYPAIAKELYHRLFEFNQSVITTLGFKNGSAHHELFLRENTGEIIFLEIAARVPGGIGVPFHTKNSNINLIDANLYLAIDKALLQKINPQPKNNVVSALLPVGHGVVKSLNQPDIESKYDITWHIHEGMKVDSRSLIDTAGILMLYNDDPEALRRDFKKLHAYVPVTCS